MKSILFTTILSILTICSHAQAVGDTIKVKTFHYGSTNRDTFINFPSDNINFEKIILKYNMRCKNGLISDGNDRNKGCGEWDYSCNTYIVDSTKMEEEIAFQPDYVVSNYTNTLFHYTTKPVWDYYDYTQKSVSVSNASNELSFAVNNGNIQVSNLLKTNEKSGKTQIIYSAAELATAGLSAGNIDALLFTVTNSGGTAHFFKVKIKHTNATTLTAKNVDLTGYTEVYNNDYNFTIGNNRIQFNTPFNWNGTQNILVEISFTNSIPSNPIDFLGTTSDSVVSIYANNNYALDLSELGHVQLNTSALNSIQNELTISFWAYGNSAMMPSATSILYGYATNPNERNLNIHLPFSNNNIYFDCGYNGGYDRIEKTATAAEQGGKWNYWTFTKNATTGSMKIFLNGVLWTSGTGKTKPISLLNVILGKNSELLSNYKGKINELTIWNKVVADSIISGWMNRPIDATHPLYNNLVEYYKLNEGNGLTIHDAKNNTTSVGENLNWNYERGDKLNRTFFPSFNRPNITFITGMYNLVLTDTIQRDSIIRNPKVIKKYSIISKSGISPISSDLIKLDSTITQLYQAVSSNIYNGDNGSLVSTMPVTNEGSIVISNLSYYKRYPFYNEIQSFVTPYGIGLDLGINGKTWYYDVTDFTPILKGPKRILMTLGGQNQEQMDVEFWFIVGTPVQNVLEFNQLWQGTNRTGSPSIGNINNNTRLAPVTVPLNANGKRFKIRSSITGHGAEGEFEANGGTINHLLDINNGSQLLSWRITEPCSFNPVFPQGGTWIYPREGWCPGQSSLLKEQDITPIVIAGTNLVIDYNTSSPPNPSGDYRYHIAHQLVTYGNPNFNLDASIIEIMEPTDKILYARTNPMCSSPKIIVKNTGSTTITKLDINYWINNTTVKQTYVWTGNLTSLNTTTISLPINTLWNNGMQSSNNVFKAEIVTVNNSPDEYTYNNLLSSPFNKPDVLPGSFTIDFKTNNTPEATSYTLIDENGVVIDEKKISTANTLTKTNYTLNGCYRLIVEDTDEDGLSWFGTPNQGSGFIRIRNAAGGLIKTLQPDFGRRLEYGFNANFLLNTEEPTLDFKMNVYPNPSKNTFTLEGEDLTDASIVLTDILGHTVNIPYSKQAGKLEFNSSSLSQGIYLIIIKKNNQQAIKRIVIQ